MEEQNLRVQYMGYSGYTLPCLLAIDAILSSDCLPERATIVSCKDEPPSRCADHLFLFWEWWPFPVVIVPSGFRSGYSGEAPKGFALAICMIRDKNIPLDGIYVSRSVFDKIDNGLLLKVSDPLWEKVKAGARPLSWPWSLWVWEEYENLLERGQLWREYYWRRSKTDIITETMANIDSYEPDVGRKLRFAQEKILDSYAPENWQSAGIIIRDAWIELVQKLCQDYKISMSGIKKDDARGHIKRLKFDDRVLNMALSAFDLSLKIQHDRKVSQKLAMACLLSTVVSMNMLLPK